LGNKKLFPQSYGNTLGPPDSVRTETKPEAVSLKKDFLSNYNQREIFNTEFNDKKVFP
jgi:hypothetical protein